MSFQQMINQQLDARADEFLDVLFRLVREPSISTQGTGVRECADVVASVLQEYGISARIMETAGFPVVYGERIVSPDARTLLIYGHYDVQPPEPFEAWDSPPFEPEVRDGRIYGRGVGDNKGQFLAHILALSILKQTGQLPPVNLKFLLEGEEESGSPNLHPFIHDHRDLLSADLFYAADGPMHPSQRPIVFFGLRGTLKLELQLTGANRDLHSGNFGGPIPNGAWELVDLLASMRDEDGNIIIDGFYDQVQAPTPFERELLDKIPFDAEAVKADLSIDRFVGTARTPYYEKIMFQPTLTITGINSGYTGRGAKSVIPSKAVAKLECRLVANQRPEESFKLIEAHVRRVAPRTVVRYLGGTLPSKTSPELPVARVVTQAITEAYGVEPAIMPVLGASGPNFLFTDVLGLPTVWTTYGPPDENNHAPNENMTLKSFYDGIRASAYVIQRFATMQIDDTSDAQ